MSEKLQKVLARAGLGSRREIEAWISAGLVRINGSLAKLGDRVGGRDEIHVRGRRLTAQDLLAPETQVLLYHKPEGELVTRSDEKGRETVFAHLPKPKSGRWIAVGRLDINTTGLLLLTNNGELANRLMHPSQAVERSYLVRVFGEVSQEVLEKLMTGVTLEDGMAQFDSVVPMLTEETDSLNRWYLVTLLEGRNREVRRLWESQGVRVSRLKRIAFGGVSLPKNLKQGKSQLAMPDQVNALLGLVDLAPLSQPRQEAPRIKRARNFALTAAKPRGDSKRFADSDKRKKPTREGQSDQRDASADKSKWDQPKWDQPKWDKPKGNTPSGKPTDRSTRYDREDNRDDSRTDQRHDRKPVSRSNNSSGRPSLSLSSRKPRNDQRD